MDYFILRQIKEDLCCFSSIVIVDQDLIINEHMVLYADVKKEGVFADVLQKPYFSVREELYWLIEKYQTRLESRPYILRNIVSSSNCLYYLLKPPIVDCIDESSKLDKQNFIQQLVLDSSKIDGNKFFIFEKGVQRFYIIDQELVELAYSNGICMFNLEKLETR